MLVVVTELVVRIEIVDVLIIIVEELKIPILGNDVVLGPEFIPAIVVVDSTELVDTVVERIVEETAVVEIDSDVSSSHSPVSTL